MAKLNGKIYQRQKTVRTVCCCLKIISMYLCTFCSLVSFGGRLLVLREMCKIHWFLCNYFFFFLINLQTIRKGLKLETSVRKEWLSAHSLSEKTVLALYS